MIRRLLILFSLLLAPAIAEARGIEPQLVAEGPAPPGGEVELAIEMRTNPGWHGYWLNPGDAGLPMDVKWTLPPGYSVGAAPLSGADAADRRRHHELRLREGLCRPRAAEGAEGRERDRADPRDRRAGLRAPTRSACRNRGAFALDVPVGAGPPTARQRFDEWRKALPRPLAMQATFAIAGNTLRVAIPLPRSIAVEKPYFFPAADGPVDYAGEQRFRRLDDLLIAELPRRSRPAPAVRRRTVVRRRDAGWRFARRVGKSRRAAHAIGDTGTQAILWAVLGAMLGGFLLNLMPCVFPILALKALHLAKSGGDERTARRDAIGYAAGAIVGTGALGAALLVIRAAGTEVGWAFQLQDPRTIIVLSLLATAITLNLLRVFEAAGAYARSLSQRTALVPALWRPSSPRPARGHFLAWRWGRRCFCRRPDRSRFSQRSGLGLALPFVAVAFVPALRTPPAQARSLDGAPATIPRHPDGA